MRRIGLVAGEHPVLFRRSVAALRDRLVAAGIHPDLLVAEAHGPDVQSALARGDYPAAERSVVAAAARLVADGAEVLAMPSWRLQEFAESIESAVSVPYLRLDAMIGRALAATGVTHCGFLAHSEASVHPFVRWRVFTEFEIELVSPYEDSFEAVDAWSMDWDVDPVPPRKRELALGWIRRAWKDRGYTIIVTERSELTRIASRDLGYRNIVEIESEWVAGVYRHLLDLPEPSPKLRPQPTISYDTALKAQSEVCRLLKCDSRNVDFTTDRDGEIEVVAPNVPGVERLPDWIEGVRIIKP